MSTSPSLIRVVGIGGTLRENSTSLWALQRSLEAARNAGASTELLDLRRLDLPMFQPDWLVSDYGENVQHFVKIASHADAFIISTGAYHGSLAGVTKNALDYFEYLSDAPTPYLENKPVGLIATASGEIANVNSINAMVHVVHSLRGFALPLSAPIHDSKKAFDAEGNVIHAKYATRLDKIGTLVVETAQRHHNHRAKM